MLGFGLLALFCRHCLEYDGEPLIDVWLLRWPATRAASAAAGAPAGTDNARGFAASIVVLSAAALVGALLSLKLPKTED